MRLSIIFISCVAGVLFFFSNSVFADPRLEEDRSVIKLVHYPPIPEYKEQTFFMRFGDQTLELDVFSTIFGPEARPFSKLDALKINGHDKSKTTFYSELNLLLKGKIIVSFDNFKCLRNAKGCTFSVDIISRKISGKSLNICTFILEDIKERKEECRDYSL